LARTSGAGSGLPAASNSRVVGPRELKTSAVLSPESFHCTAAMASAPFAEAASGLIVGEFVLCSPIEKVPKLLRAMYFMKGVPAPAVRWIATP
jgi:hypothetical protein